MSDSDQKKTEPKEEKEISTQTKENAKEKENNIIQEEKKDNLNKNKEETKEKEEEKENEEKEEEKENEEEKEEEKEKSESSKDSDSESDESKESKKGKGKKEKDSEENEEDDDEDDDVDDDDNDEGNSDETDSYRKQKDPYHEYLNSKIQFTSFFSCISRNDYVYGIKQNKFYKIVDTKNLSRDKKAQIYQFELKELKPENKDKKVNIKLMKNMQYMTSLYGEAKETEKDLQQKETKEINDKNENNNKDNKNNSEDLNSNKEKKEEKEIKEENKEDKSEEKKEKNEIEKKEKNEIENKEKEKGKDKEKNLENPYKKKNKKKQKNNNLTVVIKDLLEYTFFQKIRVIYLNSLNNAVVLYLKIDINTTIIEIINKFASLYHYKSNSRSDKLPLSIFINGKMHSISNNTKCKFFIPTKFDYKNDYVLILEKQITKLNEYELSTSYNNLNLKGIVVPHVVYNSLYNFEIDSFLISKNMDFLDCQIYELKKDINIRQFTDNENTMKQKMKEFLDLNWKEKTTLLTSFQSVKAKKSKDSYKANLFVLNRNFILLQGKMYIFVIRASNKRIYTFYGDDISSDGILIISRNDKSIINGFRGKPISDFRANS